jgi:hypothetical protein
MSIIRPELARTRSDENAWLKLSVVARRALDWAIGNGKTKVRVHYRNHYQYFRNDIKILEQIGYEVKWFDGVAHKDFTLEEFMDPNFQPTSEYVSYIEISW